VRGRFSRDELDLIEKAGQGDRLVVTGGRRVWARLYGETWPTEFASFHTDSEPEDEDREARRDAIRDGSINGCRVAALGSV